MICFIICNVKVICNGYVAVMMGKSSLGVASGRCRDVFVKAMCYFSMSLRIPSGFSVMYVGMSLGPHSSRPYHSLLLIITLYRLR